MICQPFPPSRRELARVRYYGKLLERAAVLEFAGKTAQAAIVKAEARALDSMWARQLIDELRECNDFTYPQETEPCGDGQDGQ